MSDSFAFPRPVSRYDADELPWDFVPVTMSRSRRDGWTPERQRAFIAALSRTGIVARAARAVGMSAKSAYALYNRAPPGGPFARAWNDAIWEGRERALSRAVQSMHGTIHVRRVLPGGQWVEQRFATRAGEPAPWSRKPEIR
ncbi:hypothetical protein D1610_01725 [Sphingomonas gilva]|uniref:Uncharacterized protein n=1 Tax=Sphingomonas gilva TaxID=2305907 RepID=A0A396RQV0_9SPHN|nr:hypothetical protein [Sphingomonas gilva]RHW18888.1 hypothetical protein D1610_01725 [Sphingomonas gilva]